MEEVSSLCFLSEEAKAFLNTSMERQCGSQTQKADAFPSHQEVSPTRQGQIKVHFITWSEQEMETP